MTAMGSSSDPTTTDEPSSKRLRTNDGNAAVSSSVIVAYNNNNNAAEGIRKSSLPSPTMKLTGHKGSVYALQYSPSGNNLASAGFDMKVFLWSHSTDDMEDPQESSSPYQNYNVLEGHKNAILDLRWTNETTIVTASADRTLMLWDAYTGQRIRKFVGHKGIINALDTAAAQNGDNDNNNDHLVMSASDDGTAKLWDLRQKRETGIFCQQDYPITAIAYDGSSNMAYTAGIDGLITVWDIKAQQKTMALKGHSDIITSLALHPSGNTHLLSNSMDNTLRTWDVRPFCAAPQRHCKTFVGATHNAEKGLLKAYWSPDGSMLTAGSADRMVHIWDEHSTEELYLLPGHKGSVNTVIFHPKENIIASGSSDKSIFVGELGE